MGNQFVLYRQYKTIPHHIVYNQIKENGRDESALGLPSSRLEVGAMVPNIPGNDLLTPQKLYQKPVHV